MTRSMRRIWAAAAFLAGLNLCAAGVMASVHTTRIGPVAVIWDAPCPAECGGPDDTRPLDTDNASYTCCKAGACRTCSACPFFLRLWC